MDTLIFVLELIGTLAFAASGAMTGVRKNMDIFGVAILGLTTAVGGGVIRDLILGSTPPRTFQDPIYAGLAVATAIAVFIVARRGWFEGRHQFYDLALLVMDSLGLGAFTVTGVGAALEAGQDGAFLLIFVGVVTGVGGGVLRDVLAGDTPYIFVKHVYACASLLGAIVCVLLQPLAGESVSVVAGMLSVVALRFLSAYFHWNLPHARVERSTERPEV